MTCKDCIHDGVCYLQEVTNDIDEQLREFGCEDFKNKADLVEVVRCRDCKHYKPYDKPVEDFDGKCIVRECETDENEFCSYGERRDT